MLTRLCQFRVLLHRFREDESGAVTVDWVVLTAGMIGMTLAAFAVFEAAFAPSATNLGTELEEYTISTSFD
jgi:Flp pilus assembly protein TadG